MVQRREIVREYVSRNLTVSRATRIAEIKRSTYYYRPNGRPKGKAPSTHTLKMDGRVVSNKEVVEEIVTLISPEYHDYGYQIITDLLKRLQYIINHKKVYRLMKEEDLLHPPVVKGKFLNKDFIIYTVPPLTEPFTTIEADIKYVFIHEENRNAYLLTFLCTFSRYAISWELDYKMKNEQVNNLADQFLAHPEVMKRLDRKDFKVNLRTDNGPQFIAKMLAKELEEKGISHEFIHPGTPQENGHIESFHNTVTRLVCNRNIFQNIEHARKIFTEFYFQYNNTRVMKSLLTYPPAVFLKLWDKGFIGIKKNKKNKEVFFFREKPTSELEASLSSEVLGVNNKNNIFDHLLINQQEISPVL